MNARSITLGHYIPGNSLLHKLDPRVKLISLLILLTALFFIKTFYGFFLYALIISLIFSGSGLPWRYFFRGLKPVFYIVIFNLLIHFFFTKGGQVYWRFGALSIEQDGVFLGTFMTLRLILLVITTLLITLTTSPVSFSDGIEYLLRPLRPLGVPGQEIAMMMTIALRFIPTLMEESDKIRKAQMARGADFETGNVFRRARQMVPILAPLFISAFRRADELAIAMEARCYRSGEKRTRMRELKIIPPDYICFAAAAAICTAIIVTGI